MDAGTRVSHLVMAIRKIVASGKSVEKRVQELDELKESYPEDHYDLIDDAIVKIYEIDGLSLAERLDFSSEFAD